MSEFTIKDMMQLGIGSEKKPIRKPIKPKPIHDEGANSSAGGGALLINGVEVGENVFASRGREATQSVAYGMSWFTRGKRFVDPAKSSSLDRLVRDEVTGRLVDPQKESNG